MAREPRAGAVTPREDELDPQNDEEILDPRDDGQGGEAGDGDDRDPTGQNAEGGEEFEDEETGQGQNVDPDDPDERTERVAGRASQRIQRLNREIQDLRRQVQGGTQPPAQQPRYQPPQEETEQAFQARLALLGPDEREAARFERFERRQTTFFHNQSLITSDNLDKANYNAKSVADPRFKKYESAVEAKRLELINTTGQIVPREVLLKLIIGERVLNAPQSDRGKQQRRQARQNVQREQVRPGNARGDVQRG